MNELAIFTDGSLNPQMKVGVGGIMIFDNDILQKSVQEINSRYFIDLMNFVYFQNTSSTKLEIETLLKAIDDRLPDPSVEVMLTIPYSRGDLLAKVHEDGKVLKTEHNDVGTQVHAFVPSELAHLLKQIAISE